MERKRGLAATNNMYCPNPSSCTIPSSPPVPSCLSVKTTTTGRICFWGGTPFPQHQDSPPPLFSLLPRRHPLHRTRHPRTVASAPTCCTHLYTCLCVQDVHLSPYRSRWSPSKNRSALTAPAQRRPHKQRAQRQEGQRLSSRELDVMRHTARPLCTEYVSTSR
jgi:hypothetical protein